MIKAENSIKSSENFDDFTEARASTNARRSNNWKVGSLETFLQSLMARLNPHNGPNRLKEWSELSR
ncbi:MAG TPA: hypothetical protein VF182_11130 [Candidatus Binatia bacterium]